MKSFSEILFSDWSNALGWTLLHSIWQSLIILLITMACLRVAPAMRSGLRYIVACAGFVLMIIASAVTFILVQNNDIVPHSGILSSFETEGQAYLTDSHLSPSGDLLSSVTNLIDPNIPFVVALWALGFIFYAARLSGGLLQTYRLRTGASRVDNDWNTFLTTASRKLGIDRLISIAESSMISTPMVIGYVKPVILIPVGMLSGLTTEQLETIFLHELAHIKRNDYLINIIQTIFETVFFFNPFVKVLSNEIRKEREYCCDDLVIRHHGGTRAYAYALAQLAEAKLSSSGFALALADDKNQLLNRIKRIMEQSVKSYSGKSRFAIPVVVLGALLCISWLGSGRTDVRGDLLVGATNDTVPDKKENSARYSRKSIITFDENGQPHEQVVEEFEGDESLRPLMEKHIPVIPHVDVIPPNAPSALDPLTPVLPTDTIPPTPFGFRNNKEWEEFSKSFEENLKSRFESLHGLHNLDTGDFRLHFGDDFPFPDFENFNIPDEALKAFENFENSDAFLKLNEQLEHLRDLEFERFRDFEETFDINRGRMGSYEDVLRDELVKDGYLSKGEPIESLEWNNDSFKVNGKAIKESDEKKYKSLNDKFFGAASGKGKVE